MVAALGLAGVGVGVLLVWSAVANVSPVDVARSVLDPSITPAALNPEPVTDRASTAGATSGGASPAPPLVLVFGVQVAATIARQTHDLFVAAQRAGIAGLGGSGYRSTDRQIELRRKNCDGDVYGRPASQCSPPTAKPGQSMHEKGLAIDFTQHGRSLTRSSPAYRWLQQNASKYGFQNLPSEPWHWSVNGK